MADNVGVRPYSATGAVTVAAKDVNGVLYPLYAEGVVSQGNSTTTALNDGQTFTGDWEDVGHHGNVVVAVKTDQDGEYYVQFSPDGVNVDSSLTRYYRTANIEAPHKFTITRQYCRIVFTNNSGSNQTYLRLQTIYGDKGDLNIPSDSVIAQDYDSISTRPSDYHTEVALNLRQGHEYWDKFGYNTAVPSGTALLAEFGGQISIFTTASTYTVTSSSSSDTLAGTGAQQLIFYGVDENWNFATEIVDMNGTGNAVTTTNWLSYPNRVAMYLCGSGQTNAGKITVTRTTGGATVATMPAGEGVTQQCIFTIAQSYKFLADWIYLKAARQAAQNPFVTFKFWVYSAVNNGKQLIYADDIDTAVELSAQLTPEHPFKIGEKSIIWVEVTSDQADTIVRGRFSGEAVRDVDA